MMTNGFGLCAWAPLRGVLCALCVSAVTCSAAAEGPELDRPTLRCLGARWVVSNAGADAAVALEYRKAGDAAWQKGQPLFRVEAGKHLAEKYGSKIDVPDGATLFAGSAVDLAEDTAYELRLTL